MKKTLLFCSLFCMAGLATAQSDSYRMLRARFEDSPEVRSYRLSGMMCRLIVSIIDDDDDRLAAAFQEVKKVHVITIPKEEFDERDLTVRGFKARLPKDNFELMADYDNRDESVSFYHRVENKNKNRYFVIIEEQDNVIAIEMKGYIDPAIIADKSTFSSL